MSKAEMERFAADMKSNSELAAEAKEKAGGLASLVEFVKGKGYDVSVDDAKEYIHEKAGRELNEDELDRVSGAGTTYTTTDVATTAVEATQVATTQTAETETTVGVAAEVVIVAT